jgi:hypothetical protein
VLFSLIDRSSSWKMMKVTERQLGWDEVKWQVSEATLRS